MFKKVFLVLSLLSLLSACSSINVKSIAELKDAKEIYEEGLKLVTSKEYSKAITYFEHIIDNYKGPDNEKFVSWSIYEIGFCFYQKGNNEKAISYFDTVLANAKSRGPRILADLVKNKIKKGDGYKNASYN